MHPTAAQTAPGKFWFAGKRSTWDSVERQLAAGHAHAGAKASQRAQPDSVTTVRDNRTRAWQVGHAHPTSGRDHCAGSSEG